MITQGNKKGASNVGQGAPQITEWIGVGPTQGGILICNNAN